MTEGRDLSEPAEPDETKPNSASTDAESLGETSDGQEHLASAGASAGETPGAAAANSAADSVNDSSDMIVAESISREESPQPEAGLESLVAAGSPVILELVADPPNPLRFGLRAIFVLTAMFAIQFAIISYLGPLLGLLTGIVVCAIALTVIVGIAIVFHHQHRQPWMVSLDVMAIRVSVATVMLFLLIILAGGGYLVFDRYVRYQKAAALQQELGFAATTTWGMKGSRSLQVIQITSVTPAGVAEKAGMKADDVIITTLTPDEFYDMLVENRGSATSITLAADPDLSFLEDASLRQIELKIPRGP